jgi:lipid-binding SYLF domain-containing protein
MKSLRTLLLATCVAIAAVGTTAGFNRAQADQTAADLNRQSNQALQLLYQTHPVAATIGKQALAVLIFPNIIKAGFIFGAGYGEGEMLQGEKVDGYYNSFTASWGLQAGAQSYGYAVFLMNQRAVDYIHKSAGWEIGVGPTVVVVNEGIAKNLSSTTLQSDAYAFIFDQQGLMLGISLEGTKISRIKP